MTIPKSIQYKLRQFRRLPVGWDGYRGIPLSQENWLVSLALYRKIQAMWSIHSNKPMPVPHVVLGGDGHVQYEWHRGFLSLEIWSNNPEHQAKHGDESFLFWDADDYPKTDLKWDDIPKTLERFLTKN